jgi:hypothetical protein
VSVIDVKCLRLLKNVLKCRNIVCARWIVRFSLLEVLFMDDDDVKSALERRPGGNRPHERYLFLLGSPPVREFTDFVRARSADEIGTDERYLEKEWCGAAERMRELELSESGCADGAVLSSLPEEVAPMAESELSDVRVQRAFRGGPYKWALVELDQLIAYQRRVDLGFVEQIKKAIPRHPTAEDLFRCAAGLSQRVPDVHITRVSDNVYCLSSRSSDLRFLELTWLNQNDVRGYNAPGRETRIIGAVVGFGFNFVSAFRIQGRLILVNGTHRAYALRELGTRRIPCLVREVIRDDDWNMLGATEIKQNLPLYLARRPPLLKDFFDPRLSKQFAMEPANHLVHVQINAQRSTVIMP